MVMILELGGLGWVCGLGWVFFLGLDPHGLGLDHHGLGRGLFIDRVGWQSMENGRSACSLRKHGCAHFAWLVQ